jgi:integrase
MSISTRRRAHLPASRCASRQAHSLRELGKDPKVERDYQARVHQQAPSVEGLIQQRIDAIERTSAAKTIAEYRRILKAQISGSGFAALKAKDVRRADIRAFLDGIGGDAMAINTYKLIRASFAWGLREEVVDANPAHDMKPRLEERLTDEERTLTDDELAKVLIRSEAVSPVAAAYVRIMALCGTRRTETALAKWEHLSLEEKFADGKPAPVWVIPPENRKGRAGKKRGLVVPLSPQAHRTFEELKRTSGDGDWIFSASPRANLSANFGRLGAALRKVTGVTFGFHDLRATCATGAGRLGAPPHVIAVLLGHQGVPGTPHVTSRYDRADRLPEVRLALDRWGDHIEELIKKASKTPTAATPPGTRGRLAVAS